jgi:hypothetical protein
MLAFELSMMVKGYTSDRQTKPRNPSYLGSNGRADG